MCRDRPVRDVAARSDSARGAGRVVTAAVVRGSGRADTTGAGGRSTARRGSGAGRGGAGGNTGAARSGSVGAGSDAEGDSTIEVVGEVAGEVAGAGAGAMADSGGRARAPSDSRTLGVGTNTRRRAVHASPSRLTPASVQRLRSSVMRARPP